MYKFISCSTSESEVVTSPITTLTTTATKTKENCATDATCPINFSPYFSEQTQPSFPHLPRAHYSSASTTFSVCNALLTSYQPVFCDSYSVQRPLQHKVFRLALLNCYPEKTKDIYASNLHSWIKNGLLDLNRNPHDVEIHEVHVPSGLPNMDFNGYIGSGSPSNMTDTPRPQWISNYMNWIREINNGSIIVNNKRPKAVLLCFSDQAAGETFGGVVEKNPNQEWEIGLKKTFLHPILSRFMNEKHLWIYSFHSQQITKRPSNCIRVGSSTKSENAILLYKNILSFQGHPEFTHRHQIKNSINRSLRFCSKTDLSNFNYKANQGNGFVQKNHERDLAPSPLMGDGYKAAKFCLLYLFHFQ
ncbi:hypothetical protein HOG98_07100 [bacterium]|nr:hypothetical protein [bacterium]